MENLLESLTINPQYFLVAIVNFLLALAAFYFIALKPLGKTIRERQEAINKGLDNAEKMEVKLKEMDEEFDSKLSEASKKAQEIIEEAKKEGTKLKQEKIAEGKTESESIVTQSKDGIEAEKAKLQKEMKDQIEVEVRRVLKEILKNDADLNKKVLDKAIENI